MPNPDYQRPFAMPLIDKSVLVPYAAERMFALVEDVPAYPKFLPWCAGADVLSREADRLVATLKIDFKGVKQSFTTENSHRPDHRLIEMRLKDGPFRTLDGTWRFHPLMEDACKVQLHLHYEFSSKVLETLIGPVFNQIAGSFIDAFTKRAEALYG